MTRQTGEIVLGLVLLAGAALVALGFMVAAGEMLWQWRQSRHRQPRAVDLEFYRDHRGDMRGRRR